MKTYPTAELPPKGTLSFIFSSFDSLIQALRRFAAPLRLDISRPPVIGVLLLVSPYNQELLLISYNRSALQRAMEHNFVSTSSGLRSVAHANADLINATAVTHPGPAAYKSLRGGLEGEQTSLRAAFGAISLAPASFDVRGVRQGFQSVPASCSTSQAASRSSSRSSSGRSSPSVSRQQSFTFTPPSWQDASFVSWKPTHTAPRLERSTSTPKLPQKKLLTEDDYVEPNRYAGFHDAPLADGASTAADLPETGMPLRRQPCIVGWEEIEKTKMTLFPSGKTLYRCTYCNVPLKGVKNYIVTWTKVLFCGECKGIPQCNSCYKKAVPFVYIDADGLHKRMEPLHNFGGLNICGQCALINPVTDRSAVLDLVRRGRELLQALFAIKFTERLLAPHTEPEVVSCLEALRLAADSNGGCKISVDPTACSKTPMVLRKNSSGEVAELPFDIAPVWHMQLCRNGSQNVYGRCETRALTFPSRQPAPGQHYHQNYNSPRTYRVIQRIMLSRGVPEGLIYGHLVHELLHAFIWLFLDSSSVKIDTAAEEGLCNCILAAALQMRVETLRARREVALNALLRLGLYPKTNPGIKEVQGIPQTAEFLKAVVGMGSKAGVSTSRLCGQALRAGAEQSCSYLEHQLYVTEYELKVLNRRLGEMEKDSNPAYGVGYRTIRHLATSLTVVQLIEILGKHGETLNSVVSASLANQGIPPVATQDQVHNSSGKPSGAGSSTLRTPASSSV